MRRSSRCHVHCSQVAFTSLALLLLSSFLSFSPTTTAAASSNGSKKNNNSTQVSYYCGSNRTDASRNCHEACPSGRDDECSQRGWRCFFHTGCASGEDETDSKDNMMLLLPGREENSLAKENETSTSPLNVEDPEDSHSKTPAADNFANQSLQTLVSEVLLSLSGLESEMSDAEAGLLEETVFQFLERSSNQSGISLKTVAVSRQRVYGEGERRMEARRWMNTPTNNRFSVENGHFDSSDDVNHTREIGSSNFDASQPHSKIQQSISPNSFQAVREPFQESKNYHQQSKTRQLPLSSSALDVNVVITGEYTPPPFLDMTSIATDSINRDSAQIVSDLRSRGSRNGSDFFERLQEVKSTSAEDIMPRPTIPSIAHPSSAPTLVGVTKEPTIHPVQPTIIVDEEQMETIEPSMEPTRKPKGEGEEGEENNITEENGIILDTNFILTLQNVPHVVMNDRETQKYQDVLLGYLRNQSALIELDVDVTSVEVWHQILSTDIKEREEKGGKNKSNNVSSTKKYRSKSRNLKVITDQFSYNSTHSQELPPDPTRVDVEITTVVKSSNKPHLPPYVASILILNTMVSSTTNENKNEATFVDSLRAEQLFYSYFKDVDGISIRLIDQVTIPPTSTPTTLEYYTSSVHSLNSIEGSSSGERNSTPSKNIYVAAALGIAVLWCVLTIFSLSHVRKARIKMMNESILRARRKGEVMAGCGDDYYCRDIERGTSFTGIICEGMEDAIANESNCIRGIISGDDNEGTKHSHGQRLEERSNNVILHQSPPICRTSLLYQPERNCHRLLRMSASRNLSEKPEGAFTRGSLAMTTSTRSLSKSSFDNSSGGEACIAETENDELLVDRWKNMSGTSDLKEEKAGHVPSERRRRSRISILLDEKMREKTMRNLLEALGSIDSSASLDSSCEEGSVDVVPRSASFLSSSLTTNGVERSYLVRGNASRNVAMAATETSSDEGSKEDFNKNKSPSAENSQDVARSSRGQWRGSKKTSHRDSLRRLGSTRKSMGNEEISHDHSQDDGFKTGSIPNMIITTTSDKKDSTFFVTPVNLHGADTVNKRTSDTSLSTKTADDAQGRRPMSRSKSAMVGDQRDPLNWIDDIIEKSQNEPRLNSRRKARRSSQQ